MRFMLGVDTTVLAAMWDRDLFVVTVNPETLIVVIASPETRGEGPRILELCSSLSAQV
jgi:hypothetical protein